MSRRTTTEGITLTGTGRWDAPLMIELDDWCEAVRVWQEVTT